MENNEKLVMMKILAEGLFGSWEKFLAVATMDEVNKTPYAKVNFMKALDEIKSEISYVDKKYRLISVAQDIIGELGYVPSGVQMEEELRKRHEHGSRPTFSRLFGGYRNFIALVLSANNN